MSQLRRRSFAVSPDRLLPPLLRESGHLWMLFEWSDLNEACFHPYLKAAHLWSDNSAQILNPSGNRNKDKSRPHFSTVFSWWYCVAAAKAGALLSHSLVMFTCTTAHSCGGDGRAEQVPSKNLCCFLEGQGGMKGGETGRTGTHKKWKRKTHRTWQKRI